MSRKLLIILLLLIPVMAGAGDNSATMGSYAEDFPSLRIWRSGNAYDDKGDFIAGVKFWGRNAAVIAAGAAHEHTNGKMFFDSLKIIASQNSRTLLTEAYTDFQFFVECGNSQTEDTMGFNAFPYNYWKVVDSMGLTWTDQFFQLADDSDSVVYVLRTTSCAEAADGDRKWGNVGLSANQKYQSQFGIYNGTDDENYPGTDAYFMNYADDTMNYALWKAYAYQRLVNNSDVFFGFDSSLDGFTYDNAHPESWRSSSYVHSTGDGLYWYSFGGNTGGQAWQTGTAYIDWIGYDEPFVKYGASYNTLDNAFSAAFNIMLDTMKDMGMVTSCNFVNGAPYEVDDYAARQGEVVTTEFYELRGIDLLIKTYSTITSATGVNGELSRVDSAILHGIPHVNEFRSWGAMANDTGDSYYAHTFLCAHLTYQDTSLTYFCFQNRLNGSASDGDTMYLANWDLFKLDYGDVQNARQYVDTGTTQLGDPVHLFWREYENAYAFWFPPDNMVDTVGAKTTNYYEWDCGEAVYEIGRSNPGHCDSTYRSDGVIRVGPGQGVIAWKAVSPAAPDAGTVWQGIDIQGVDVQ